MNLLKYLGVFLTITCVGCAQVKPNSAEFEKLDVVTLRVTPSALVMHMERGETYALDLAEVRVQSPGPLLNQTLPIALPVTDTTAYKQMLAAVPARKKMWEQLRAPAQQLVLEVRQSDLERYLKTKDRKSAVLPSIDALAIKSVELQSSKRKQGAEPRGSVR